MSATETTAVIPTGTWSVDPIHSSVGFGVKHLGISTFRGSFPGPTGSLETSDGEVVAVTGVVKTAGLTTQEAQLTGHLLSGDFFDAESNPEIRFTSTAVSPVAEGRFTIDGDLSIRGLSRPVRLDAEIDGIGEDPSGAARIGISARGAIDRSDWGITFNIPLANGQFAIGERVALELQIEVVRNA
jgi:polyisoprenoid-binding protein YceI